MSQSKKEFKEFYLILEYQPNVAKSEVRTWTEDREEWLEHINFSCDETVQYRYTETVLKSAYEAKCREVEELWDQLNYILGQNQGCFCKKDETCSTHKILFKIKHQQGESE